MLRVRASTDAAAAAYGALEGEGRERGGVSLLAAQLAAAML